MPLSSAPARRVLILSANVGEGHAAAARALRKALELHDRSVEVIVADGVEPLGRLLRWCVERGYRAQLERAPGTYGLLYGLVRRCPPARALGRAIIVLCGARGLQRVIDAHAPDVVVSTYPATTAVLGALRRRGRLRVPAAAVLSDFTGLELWVDKAVDSHLVMYDESLREASHRVGESRVTCVSPLIDPAFARNREPDRCRRALGVPAAGPLVVVSGGGWAVGDLAVAVDASLQLPDVHVICLAGRDASAELRLTERFGEETRVTVLGFTEQMPDVLGAADVLVHSTAGMTSLEALVSGCPVVAFDPPPGHPRRNATAMAHAGLIEQVDGPGELTRALGLALGRARPPAFASTSPSDAVLTVINLEPVSLARRHTAAVIAKLTGASAVGGTAVAGIGATGGGDARMLAVAATVALIASTARTAKLAIAPS